MKKLELKRQFKYKYKLLLWKDELLGQLVQNRKREQEDLFSSIILASQSFHEFSYVPPT